MAKRVPSFVLIACVGLLSLIWFSGSHLISSLDFAFVPSRLETLSHTFWTWAAGSPLGSANFRAAALALPYEFFRALTEILHLPVALSQKVFFYLILILAGFSMHYLAGVLGGRSNEVPRISASLFYMLNPYVMTFLWPQVNLSLLTYAFLPLKLGMFIQGVKQKRGIGYAFVVAVVWVVTTSSADTNPVLALIEWLAIGMYFLFSILSDKGSAEKKQILRFAVALAGFWLFMNIYWILPTFLSLGEELVAAVPSVIYPDIIEFWRLNTAPMFETFRLAGYWGLGVSYKGDPFYPWGSTFNSSLFVLIGFLLAFLAFAPLLMKKKNKDVIFFSLLALLAMFLIKGPHPPLSESTTSLFSYFKLHIVFRTAYQKFGPLLVLSYAILFGFMIGKLWGHLGESSSGVSSWGVRRLGRSVGVGLALLLFMGIYVFPLWTGDVIYGGGKVLPSARYQIPFYYEEAGRWLSGQSEYFSIFSLPLSQLGYLVTRWDSGYLGPDLTPFLLEKPVMNSGLAGYGLPGIVAESLGKEISSSALPKMLGLMGVRYILVHGDANWAYLEGHPEWITLLPDQYQKVLSRQIGIYKDREFGKLAFYGVDENYLLPLVYVPKRVVYVRGDSSSLPWVASLPETQAGDAYYFLEGSPGGVANIRNQSQNAEGLVTITEYRQPQITFVKDNPTRYRVQVRDAESGYPLVLSQTFHPGWRAYLRPANSSFHFWDTWFQKPLSEENHFMINGYANAWWIDRSGDYEVVLEFWPQRLFYVGLTISGLTLVVGAGYSIWSWRRKKAPWEVSKEC